MKSIAIDTETTGLQIRHGCRVFLVIAADEEGNMFHWFFDVDPFTRNVKYDLKTVKDMLSVLTQYDRWIFHNSLFDLLALSFINIGKYTRKFWLNLFSSRKIEDTMLVAHADNSIISKALKPLAFFHLNFPEDDEKELIDAVKKCRTIASKLGWATAEPTHPHLTALSKDKPKCDYWLPHTLQKHQPNLVPPSYKGYCLRYGLGDVERTMGLWLYWNNNLDPKILKAYSKNAECLLPTFRMTDKGFSLLEDKVPNTLNDLAEFKNKTQSSLNTKVKATGWTPPKSKSPSRKVTEPSFTFNPASPPQLQKLLFETLKLPCPKFTAKGNPSTDKESITNLLDNDKIYKNETAVSILEDILTLRKVKSTEGYLKNYQTYQVNNVLYPSLNPAGTKTLRYSCNNPNTQNISVKEDERYADLGISFSLRHMFGPPKGHLWACIDYSQLQLRIFAYACGDQQLIDSFERGADVHDTVARAIFNIPPSREPTKTQRVAAKGINFGIIFGAGKNKIERMTGQPGTFDMFRQRFPLVESYIKQEATLAKQLGYCLTMGGYPLRVQSSKAYKACNYEVQGTEGELVKQAIVKTDAYCLQSSILFEPVMTIHDEIIFQSKEPMSIADASRIRPKAQLNTIMKLMNDAAAEVGVKTEVDCKLTDTVWSLAS